MACMCDPRIRGAPGGAQLQALCAAHMEAGWRTALLGSRLPRTFTRFPTRAHHHPHPTQVQLLGQTISVGRPSGYVDPSKAASAATAAAAALDAFQKGDMEQLAQHAAAAGMNLAQLGLATLMLQAKSGAAAAAAAAVGTAGAAAGGEKLPPPPPLPGTGNGAAAVAAVAAAIGHGQPEADAEGAGAAGSGAGAGAGGDVSPYLEVDGMLSEDLLVEDEEYESVSNRREGGGEGEREGGGPMCCGVVLRGLLSCGMLPTQPHAEPSRRGWGWGCGKAGYGHAD